MAVVEDKVSGKKIQVTQYDGHYVESVGLIKMDFLGLITLSIMKEAVRNIKKHTGEDIDIFTVPIDDPEVYRLYAEGRTVGIFQFESAGMQKYLKELQPSVFEDLIAMNALYRPGPMDYIPQFIERKQGREPITYDIPVMEKYLKDTYGITVYQEQVMLLSRLLANFTRGESDKLRKAMGKKQIAVLNELKPKFINQGKANGHDPAILEKIWADWEKFASYAFNKSHATCYSWVSYQTAYLKCHYPAEFMAALLTNSKNDISEVSKYMEECKTMGLSVMGPDVNNSEMNFSVSHDGAVVFGLGGVKGVGEAAVDAIITERDANGPFKSIYDFVERVNLSACNRKTIESLAMAGAFDSLGDIRREQFFAPTPDGLTGSEMLMRYGNGYQDDKKNREANLFGEVMETIVMRPLLPDVIGGWSELERLNKEKEMVGIYISSHPLKQYDFVMRYIVNTPVVELKDDVLAKKEGQNFICAGIVTSIKTGNTRKTNKPYVIGKVEDTSGDCEFALFGNDFVSYAPFFTVNSFVCITGNVGKSMYNDTIRKNITKVEFLSDVLRPGRVRSVTLDVDLKSVNDVAIDMFKETFTQNKNKPQNLPADATPYAPVRFHVIDRDRHMDVHLASREYSVELGARLIKMVDGLDGVEMTVQQ